MLFHAVAAVKNVSQGWLEGLDWHRLPLVYKAASVTWNILRVLNVVLLTVFYGLKEKLRDASALPACSLAGFFDISQLDRTVVVAVSGDILNVEAPRISMSRLEMFAFLGETPVRLPSLAPRTNSY